MSLVTGVFYDRSIDSLCCWCPSCGEHVVIFEEEDFCGVLDDGYDEYYLHCPECDQGFYASKSYD